MQNDLEKLPKCKKAEQAAKDCKKTVKIFQKGNKCQKKQTQRPPIMG